MDLVHGARCVAVITDYVTEEGRPKLLRRCAQPLTGVGCVTRIYTSHAVVDIKAGHLTCARSSRMSASPPRRL